MVRPHLSNVKPTFGCHIPVHPVLRAGAEVGEWQHALELSRRRNERGLEALTLRLLGEIHSHHDALNAGQAEGSYRQAMAVAQELGMRPLVAHCHFGLGKLYARIGRRDESGEHLAAATTMYREMDMRFWLKQAEAEMRDLSSSKER
jgi:tetratricopeptide (TPR) repeat protein